MGLNFNFNGLIYFEALKKMRRFRTVNLNVEKKLKKKISKARLETCGTCSQEQKTLNVKENNSSMSMCRMEKWTE